ncbi:hypothetical protein pdam_00013477 [Pocillopora damicornis]|uniref:G-protein coupled receptors family 1 profile domain-containing protein n=1 Tax=Pocillopora damicornis TaxID=46731 RepID=A0A3M6TEU6_POCDA|nr:hypothetical protein pdam_00013477 [Pocillopora damicornis]
MNFTDRGNGDTESSHLNEENERIITIINSALNVPLILTSILGNGLVVAVIVKNRSLQSPSMIFLFSLALSDLLVGMMAFFVCGVSLDTVTAISVDRLMALTYHLRYPSLVTPCRIYGIVRRHRLRIDAQQLAVRGNCSPENVAHMARLRKSALNMFVFYIVLILCYFPMYILSTLHGASLLNWETKWDFAHTAVFMNSSINPVLYCWRLPELREAIVKMLRKIFCVQTHQN